MIPLTQVTTEKKVMIYIFKQFYQIILFFFCHGYQIKVV